MPKLTRKYFDRLHKVGLVASIDYNAGYFFGQGHRDHYQSLTTDEMREARSAYLSVQTEYCAGIARVLLEIIAERESMEDAA